MELLAGIPDRSVDLVVTDPPYVIHNTRAGVSNKLCKSIQSAFNELKDANIVSGFDKKILDELWRVMKAPNIYIWCNKEQIFPYLDFFVEQRGCKWELLAWVKTNAMPTYNGKYLTDKEYCLYFRRGGYCKPMSYESARTIWLQPINIKDKQMYHHPTIKPLNIISTLVKNSSREGDVVLDPFMGSGTTGVACVGLKREFIGMELKQDYFEIAQRRIAEAQITLFDNA